MIQVKEASENKVMRQRAIYFNTTFFITKTSSKG